VEFATRRGSQCLQAPRGARTTGSGTVLFKSMRNVDWTGPFPDHGSRGAAGSGVN
jgi:hypothetical protein